MELMFPRTEAPELKWRYLWKLVNSATSQPHMGMGHGAWGMAGVSEMAEVLRQPSSRRRRRLRIRCSTRVAAEADEDRGGGWARVRRGGRVLPSRSCLGEEGGREVFFCKKQSTLLSVVGHQNEWPDGPALEPDGPRSGQSAPVGRTVRAGAEQIMVLSFLLCLLAKISG
jgi:hypothetical protein